jgi:hypothetical protein
MQNILSSIKISLPRNTFEDIKSFIELFENTTRTRDAIEFPNKPVDYSPKVELEFAIEISKPQVVFHSEESELLKIILQNETGEQWDSPYLYKHISLTELIVRLKTHDISFQYYDHLGIDLPWLEGEHPQLTKAYKTLSPVSLIHSFPGNSDWVFLIPGTKAEIFKEVEVDYNLDRKPKFEFVNFKYCSTPILQIDLATNAKYETVKEIFPEAIHDDELRNAWVYLENNSGIDICLVLNESGGNGWTKTFAGSLLQFSEVN